MPPLDPTPGLHSMCGRSARDGVPSWSRHSPERDGVPRMYPGRGTRIVVDSGRERYRRRTLSDGKRTTHTSEVRRSLCPSVRSDPNCSDAQDRTSTTPLSSPVLFVVEQALSGRR